MTAVGDDAPDFTASLVNDDIEPFRLADHLGDGPVVLAFFPAAFSNTCTDEMEALRDEFDRDDCALFGVSTDLPHALAAYRTQYDLPFALVGDPDHRAIESYDVIEDFEHYGVETVAQRAVFVIDGDGTVTYRWLADNSGQEPDYDALAGAVAEAAE
ncbi:redoxin domain-containing protein [Halorubrum sp. AD140]|uniref:redoxin domain-containing protein n=1 Tax=Halorubrum sp. AD140 TaxID=3050073 RepID=UPI002ACCF4C0|nr:redoxin domain-containing protein [Halorubrum sp. AD140]MDZ5812453.1 redoxin domain-containing protein [Halorubrum sp. AD140]